MTKSIALFTVILLFSAFIAAQSAGTLDSTFNGTGIVELQANNTNTAFSRVRVLPDGKILAIGFVRMGLMDHPLVVQFNNDGTLDENFGNNGVTIISNALAYGSDGYVLPDGKIFITGFAYASHKIALFRLQPNGLPDSTFGTFGAKIVGPGLPSLYDECISVQKSVIQPDGKVIVIGSYFEIAGSTFVEQGCVSRFLPDGSKDDDFGAGNAVKITSTGFQKKIIINGVKVQPDGKIIIVGSTGNTPSTTDWYLTRLMSNGAVDSTFGSNGIVIKNIGSTYSEAAYDLMLLPDGKIVGAGNAQYLGGFHFTMVRFYPNGGSDASFGSLGKAQVKINCCYSTAYEIIRQQDGKLVACGYSSNDNHRKFFAVTRFTENGQLDQSFANNGALVLEFGQDSISQRAGGMALQPDGKILVSGYSDNYLNPPFSGILLRLFSGSVVGSDAPESNSHLVKVTPNPFHEQFVLEYKTNEAGNYQMRLYDLLGRRLESIPLKGVERTIEAGQSLRPGVYVARLEKDGQVSKAVKVVKQE